MNEHLYKVEAEYRRSIATQAAAQHRLEWEIMAARGKQSSDDQGTKRARTQQKVPADPAAQRTLACEHGRLRRLLRRVLAQSVMRGVKGSHDSR